MKRFVASVLIVLAALSTAGAHPSTKPVLSDSRGAQEACYPGSQPDLAEVIGLTIGAPVGSTIGDGRGQTLATGAGALLGGVIGEALSPRRPTPNRGNALVKEFDSYQSQMIEAAVSGRIPMPRKARPVRLRQRLTRCQEIEPGTLACQDSAGAWHIVK